MRWASGRATTREEDIAYCLLGLFNVNMPLLYGEGPKAFQRLQEEIVRNDGDYTILAWPGGNDDGRTTSAVSALAESPVAFSGPLSFPENISVELREKLTQHAWGHLHSHKIRRKSYTPPMIVSLGLLLTLPVRIIEVNPGFKWLLVSTECAIHLDRRVMVLCIDLRADNHTYIDDLMILQRISNGGPTSSHLQAIDETDLKDMSLMRMYLPRPRDRVPSLGLGSLMTGPGHNFLQILLPAPRSPRVRVIGTMPKLPVVPAPRGLRNGTQPPDSTFYLLTYPLGNIDISVLGPDRLKFSILYRASTVRRQPASCLVLPFHRFNPKEDPLGIVRGLTSLDDSLADKSARTDRTARSFPEHGLQIRASIKMVPVAMGGNGVDGGGSTSLCVWVAIDAACWMSILKWSCREWG